MEEVTFQDLIREILVAKPIVLFNHLFSALLIGQDLGYFLNGLVGHKSLNCDGVKTFGFYIGDIYRIPVNHNGFFIVDRLQKGIAKPLVS